MSGEINVISRTQRIIVDPVTSSVAVINAGPPGPNTGIPGPPGVVQNLVGGRGIGIDSNTPASPIVALSGKDWNVAWGFLGFTGLGSEVGTGGNPSGECVILAMPAVTYTANRRIKLTYSGSYRCTTPGDFFNIRIRRGTGTVGTILMAGLLHAPQGPQYQVPFSLVGIDQMVGGTNQWTINIQRGAGTGTMSFLGNDAAGGNWASQFIVEDIGPVTPQV
jgi:hypothetical protein